MDKIFDLSWAKKKQQQKNTSLITHFDISTERALVWHKDMTLKP